jgi:hypothetical protein
MDVTDIPFNGERYGGVKDSAGNIWWIATHVKDVSLDECARGVEAFAARCGTANRVVFAKSSCHASIEIHAFRTPNRCRRTSQTVSVSVIKASPANFRLSSDRLAASSFPPPHASVTSTGT